MNFEDYQIDFSSKATLVSIVCPNLKGHEDVHMSSKSLEELAALLMTLNIEVGESFSQNKQELEAATMLGKGKLLEIAQEAEENNSKLLVFDFELTASQMRNIKKLTNMQVIDRCLVILEIFARHARTKEAKIQIEISKLNYMLPRLTSLWTHFSKQKGGRYMKGEGEQQLELDRRIIRSRIDFLKEQLVTIEKSRKQQQKKRLKKAVTAALVGYTNAGKSSLMNKLCKVDILSEDKLFATLDATYRMLNPDTKPPMILIDTVGFIQNLPSTLVQGFKTTLASAIEADILILVCDLSDPNYQQHIEVTNEVLKELNILNKEKVIVFTKKDKLKDKFTPIFSKKMYKDSFVISANDSEDISSLREYIIDYFLESQSTYELFIPYEDGSSHSQIQAKVNIVQQSSHEKGIFYQVKAPDFIFKPLNLGHYLLGPHNQEFIR